MRTPALVAACALAAAVLAPPASADPYDVTPHCGWSLQTVPDTDDVLLVLVAEGHATGPAPAATTTVTCTVENKFDETLTASGSSIGSDVYAASSRVMRFAPPSYCVTAAATWIDPTDGSTHSESSEELCEDAVR